MHDALIFDLDGTLWDTSAACAVSWNNVLARTGIAFRVMTEHDVRAVTGLSHEGCIRAAFAGLSEQQLLTLVRETIIEDNLVVRERGADLYPGVREGIVRLAATYPLFIVSNCQSGYIEMFTSLTNLSTCFVDFECWGNTGLSKAENLASVIARNALKRALFIGDMQSDQTAARETNTPFAFVEYGFGDCPDAALRFATFDALIAHLT